MAKDQKEFTYQTPRAVYDNSKNLTTPHTIWENIRDKWLHTKNYNNSKWFDQLEICDDLDDYYSDFENDVNFDFKGSVLEPGRCDFSSVSSDSPIVSENDGMEKEVPIKEDDDLKKIQEFLDGVSEEKAVPISPLKIDYKTDLGYNDELNPFYHTFLLEADILDNYSGFKTLPENI